MVFGSGAFGRWLGYEGRALRNGVRTLVRADTGELPPSLLPSPWSHVQFKKLVLIRHWIYQHLDGEPPSPENSEKCLLQVPYSLRYFVTAASVGSAVPEPASAWHLWSTYSTSRDVEPLQLRTQSSQNASFLQLRGVLLHPFNIMWQHDLLWPSERITSKEKN